MPTLIDQLMPFESAMKTLAARNVLPTNLGSAELRQLGTGFHRQNFTSSRTLLTDLLDAYKKKVAEIINPQTGRREDGSPVTVGIDPATARLEIKQLQEKLGLVSGDGSISDITSDKRINLVLKTNVELHQGAGALVQGSDPAVLEAFPCWELYRLEDKKNERDWPQRFRIAAAVAGDVDAARVLDQTGRMIARKDSGIWQALGDGAGGYDDTLGNPYPPFAFNSGMWTRNIAFDEAESLGLVNINTKIASPLPLDLSQLFEVAA